jgi:hypothetical protein
VLPVTAVFSTPWLPKFRSVAEMTQFAVMVSVTLKLAVAVWASAMPGAAPPMHRHNVAARKVERFMKNASTVFGCTINPAADNRTSKYWNAELNGFVFRGHFLRLLTNRSLISQRNIQGHL